LSPVLWWKELPRLKSTTNSTARPRLHPCCCHLHNSCLGYCKQHTRRTYITHQNTINLHDSVCVPDTECHCGLPATDISSGGSFPRRAMRPWYPANYKAFQLASNSLGSGMVITRMFKCTKRVKRVQSFPRHVDCTHRMLVTE